MIFPPSLSAIQVSLSMLVFIYLFLFSSVVLGIWITMSWSKQRRERHAVRFRVLCSLCAFDFEAPPEETLPRCPRCGSLNERRPYRPL